MSKKIRSTKRTAKAGSTKTAAVGGAERFKAMNDDQLWAWAKDRAWHEKYLRRLDAGLLVRIRKIKAERGVRMTTEGEVVKVDKATKVAAQKAPAKKAPAKVKKAAAKMKKAVR